MVNQELCVLLKDAYKFSIDGTHCKHGSIFFLSCDKVKVFLDCLRCDLLTFSFSPECAPFEVVSGKELTRIFQLDGVFHKHHGHSLHHSSF